MPHAHPSGPRTPPNPRSPCPDSPAAIERGWQRSTPGFDDHLRTRFFVRAPPQKGTRTHLREKRLFCAHTSPWPPDPFNKSSGANLLPNLNHSHFPACDTRAATPPYCPSLFVYARLCTHTRLRSYQTQSAVSHSELRSQHVLGLLSTGVGDQPGTAW